MAELKAVVCPKCGAQVMLERAQDRGTCTYCGTVAYVENPRRQADVKAPTTSGIRLSFWFGLAALILCGAAAVYSLLLRAPEATTAAVTTPARVVPPTPPVRVEPPVSPTPPLVEEPRIMSFEAARLVDVDGDRADELLLPIQLGGKSRVTTDHFGVFSLRDGRLLQQTPALEDNGSAVLTAVAFGRLIRALPNGRLTSYDLASGHEQWTSVLGERVAALCEAADGTPDTMQIVTDDGRNLMVDVKTGRQSETRRVCKQPLAVSSGRHAPTDRRDYRAPREMEAYRCGGVRVMGSDNYTVPDACLTRLKVDSDRLPNMVGHAIWRTPRGLLVFGVRQPGAYVPSVGLLKNKRWLWKSEVPAEDPLSAESGGPRIVSLWGDRLVIAYDMEKPQRHWVTSFHLKDGPRLWSRQLPENSQAVIAIVQTEATVVVHSEHSVSLLTRATGEPYATIRAAP